MKYTFRGIAIKMIKIIIHLKNAQKYFKKYNNHYKMKAKMIKLASLPLFLVMIILRNLAQ